MTPGERRERARRRTGFDPNVEAHIKVIVDQAPPLSSEQCDKLRLLLGLD